MGQSRDLLEQNVAKWNNHNPAGWVGDFSADAELAGPGIRGSGIEMAEKFYHIWQDAFPDNQVRVVAIFEDGDMAILQADFEGTHTETLAAPDQSIPATGKRVRIPFITLNRFTQGKLTNFTLYFDRAELLGQLGLMPATV